MTRSRTKLTVAGISLLAVLVGAAACGGGDDDDAPDSADPLPTTPVAPPPPVTEIPAGANLDPCTLFPVAASGRLGLPAAPTDTQTNPEEGKLCTWKQGQKTVVVSLYQGSVDAAAQGLGVRNVAPADVAGKQARQYAEATGCVLLFSLSGNRSLVVVGADPGQDNCALSKQVSEAAVPLVK